MSGGVDSSVAAALLRRRRPRRRRRHDAAVGRRERHRLLQRVRRRRRPPRRPAARHRPPRVQLHRRLRRRRRRAVRRRPRRRRRRRTRASSATAASSSPASPSGPTCSASTPSPPATTPASARRDGRCDAASGAPIGPRTRATSCTCSTRPSSARTLFPVGALRRQGRGARRWPPTLGLRTAAKPDSQDVCFITSTGGRHDVPAAPAPVPPGARSSTPPARRVGEVAGDRAGHDRPAQGPRPARRRAEALRRRRRPGDGDGRRRRRGRPARRRRVAVDAVTWVDGPVDGDVLVQCSAHGDAAPGDARRRPTAASTCAGAEPQRRVAPGQSVVFYDLDRPLRARRRHRRADRAPGQCTGRPRRAARASAAPGRRRATRAAPVQVDRAGRAASPGGGRARAVVGSVAA